jgi:predicted small lipoprotein YifL
MRAVTVGIVICAATLSGACGVKGPLYMPGVPKETPWPYIKPQKTSSSAPAARPDGTAPPAPPGSPEPAATPGTPTPPATGEADKKP